MTLITSFGGSRHPDSREAHVQGRQAPWRWPRNQRGFSLLEVMLATAILASSAMVLSSLLGLGAKFGGRAEARTEALSQAQSLLAEFLALASGQAEVERERTGLIHSYPPRSYRIGVEDAPLGTDRASSLSNTSSVQRIGHGPGASNGTTEQSFQNMPASRLVVVTIDVFESTNSDTDSTQSALIHLSQLVRIPTINLRSEIHSPP